MTTFVSQFSIFKLINLCFYALEDPLNIGKLNCFYNDSRSTKDFSHPPYKL